MELCQFVLGFLTFRRQQLKQQALLPVRCTQHRRLEEEDEEEA
jgi:hypothetical protein